ncbi:hypothetical protein [Sporosarcina psychrophila]|uniref:hypothetical protein n=1 Tax=Sporosarcina TaxID=1569 RepID=UPI0030D2FEB8
MNGYDIDDDCNCPAHYSYGECKHVCATVLAIADEQNVATSSKKSGTKNARYRRAEELIDYFGESNNRSELNAEDECYLKVEFLLRAHTLASYYREKDIFDIQMKIGTKRLYIVKDIRQHVTKH